MYQALYRKYRPNSFDSVVGQKPIIDTLKNSIVHKNFSHAYMFFGSRGTGKTTVSKIFARSINCLSPIDGEACQKCDACKVSFSKECVDIIEIDAASNNGVDEIRELKNNINLVPSSLKYKVYIIDEVHMLSDSAFNALLKTLEEPPQHVVFILATTDPQKVPETIVSRCQCFSFKRISNDLIQERLKLICENENITIDLSILNKIAMLSDGGLRDAIGSLDKLLSYKSENITIDDFNNVNGIISDDDIQSFIDIIFNGDISNVLLKINDFNSCGKNLIQIIIQLIEYCRNVIVDYYINHTNLNFDVSLYEELLNLFNEKMFDIKRANNTVIYIEITLLKFINDYILKSNNSEVNMSNVNKDNSVLVSSDSSSNNDNIDNYISNDSISETGIENNLNSIDNTNDSVLQSIQKSNNIILNKSNILNLDDINKVRINNTFAGADKNLLKLELNQFNLLNDYTFDSKIGYLVNSLLDSKIRVVSSDSMIISYESEGLAKENLNSIIELNDVYNKITNSNKKIAIISDDDWDSLKKEYIQNLKNNNKYVVQKEPDVLFEESDNNDIIINSAISLFGKDIVEIE